MTKEELAQCLTGRQYGHELTPELREKAKESNLLIIYGASDDLCEFDGAICEEYDCFEGGVINCPTLPVPLTVNWSPLIQLGGTAVIPSWTYTISLPCSTFLINEGDELYCVGIVIDLNEIEHINKCNFGTVKAKGKNTGLYYIGYRFKKYDAVIKQNIDVLQTLVDNEPQGVVVIEPDTICEYCGRNDIGNIPLYENDVVEQVKSGLRLKIVRDATRFVLEDTKKCRDYNFDDSPLKFIDNVLSNPFVF